MELAHRPQFATLEYRRVCVSGVTIEHPGNHFKQWFNLELLLTFKSDGAQQPPYSLFIPVRHTKRIFIAHIF